MPENGTFNFGWWNCFFSFAEEILRTVSSDATTICTSVLKNAGITPMEAKWRREHMPVDNPAIQNILYEYWMRS